MRKPYKVKDNHYNWLKSAKAAKSIYKKSILRTEYDYLNQLIHSIEVFKERKGILRIIEFDEITQHIEINDKTNSSEKIESECFVWLMYRFTQSPFLTLGNIFGVAKETIGKVINRVEKRIIEEDKQTTKFIHKVIETCQESIK